MVLEAKVWYSIFFVARPCSIKAPHILHFPEIYFGVSIPLLYKTLNIYKTVCQQKQVCF